MNETEKTPPKDVGENYLDAFKAPNVVIEGSGTVRQTRPVSASEGSVGLAEVKPITDGLVESMAVMLRVESPDADTKKKLALAWVPMANKYEHYFKKTPEIAAALGTFVAVQPMLAQYNDRKAVEKKTRADEAGEPTEEDGPDLKLSKEAKF